MRNFARLAVVVVSLASPPLWAGGMEHVREAVDAEGADRVEASLEFAAGELNIRGDDISDAAVLEIDYAPRRVDYTIDYNKRGSTGILDMESVLRSRHDVDTEDNIWDLTFSTRYPLSLDMEIGASDAEIDLSGLPVEELRLDIGAASGTLTFDRLNPATMESMDIDAGAASMECDGLGYANCREFSFSGGAGSFELDFRGDWQAAADISIEIGLGSADIYLPDDIPVRIEADTDGWLSSIDFHGDDLDEVDDNEYETSDYEHADLRLTLKLEVGLGSADVYFKH